MQNFSFNKKQKILRHRKMDLNLNFSVPKKKLFRFAVICSSFLLSLFVWLTNASILPGVYLLT